MTLLDNRYQVTRDLSEGAFGKTYIAVDTRSPMQRQCVVKQLKVQATEEENLFFQSLFKREAEVLEQIGQRANGRIPNLLAYFTQAGDHFFVMELVSGPTLAECIAQSGKQDESTVRGWLSKILETLDFLHEIEYEDTEGKKFQGVIHRDIKPRNIIIRESDGLPVLIDFGVVKEIAARSSVRTDGTMTKTAGSPYFMPPEQQNGHPVKSSDLYALGVTALVALTGKQPIELYDPLDLSFEWRKYATGTSSDLAEVLDRATKARAKERFQSAWEMMTSLNPGTTEICSSLSISDPLPNTDDAPTVLRRATPVTSESPSRLSPGEEELKLPPSQPAMGKQVFRQPNIQRVTPQPAKPQIGDSRIVGVGIEVMYIPSGEFLMGSPTSEAARSDAEFQHRVVISEPFWLGKYEVTQKQWESLMGCNPSRFKNQSLPVETVSWEDCQKFIRKLNEKDDGNTYALPTEAEWEYACRAGTTTPFFFGSTITPSQVNYDGNYPYGTMTKGLYREKTISVGSLNSPNTWGLHDMHGNVFDWCSDWHSENYYRSSPTIDPNGPLNGKYRVVRGGSWGNSAEGCRSASRDYVHPSRRGDGVGVRVVVFSALSK